MSAKDDEHSAVEHHIVSALSALSTDRPASRRRASSLPVAALLEPSHRWDVYFVVTAIDVRGRLADRSPLRVLGWEPGCAITITNVSRAFVVVTRSTGPETVTSQGHLRLRSGVRRALQLDPGARLLVVASPAQDFLAIYPAAAVEASLLAYHETLHLGGAR